VSPSPSSPADTSPEAEALQIECWRSTTIADRAEMLDRLCADVEAFAPAGIRATRSQLSEIEGSS
jgi:hypothetical protein